ncbi:MAG: FAD-dependent oxidoreductase [Alphaproteobacteria bacterium]|nr:FAD-dependent oxidoreductase [Alphaproteobacteria bacterium]
MTESGGEFDVVIIGAGAAGLSAAKHLASTGHTIKIVEARTRAGGRAHTMPTEFGFAVDLGCEWLHSADINPWVPIARQLGFTIDETLPDWGRRIAWIKGDAAQREWQTAMEAFYARLDRAADAPDDQPASNLLEPNGKWNALLGAISNWANGAEIDKVSVRDYGRYDPTYVNWRVREGYGALIGRYGEGLPVAFDTRVERIEHDGPDVRVVTDRGTLSARAVIVTLPTTVIAEERVKFLPALPTKVAAAAGLPLGVVNKLFLRLDETGARALARETDRHLVGALDRVKTGSYQIRPHGWPMIAGFYGGTLSVELERGGIDAFTAFAIEELVGLFGSDIKTHLSPIASSSWGLDPCARGSYSMALPGHADDRMTLTAPVDGRLFFAGEACSIAHFGTAHGAYLSGEEAARAAASALTPSPGRTGAAWRGAPQIPAGT